MLDFISQTIELSQLFCGRDKPRVRQTGCSICLCAIKVLLLVFWLGSAVRRARSCLTHSCMSVCVRAPAEEQASLSSWATGDTWPRSGSSLQNAGKPSSRQPLLSSTITLFWKENRDTLHVPACDWCGKMACQHCAGMSNQCPIKLCNDKVKM